MRLDDIDVRALERGISEKKKAEPPKAANLPTPTAAPQTPLVPVTVAARPVSQTPTPKPDIGSFAAPEVRVNDYVDSEDASIERQKRNAISALETQKQLILDQAKRVYEIRKQQILFDGERRMELAVRTVEATRIQELMDLEREYAQETLDFEQSVQSQRLNIEQQALQFEQQLREHALARIHEQRITAASVPQYMPQLSSEILYNQVPSFSLPESVSAVFRDVKAKQDAAFNSSSYRTEQHRQNHGGSSHNNYLPNASPGNLPAHLTAVTPNGSVPHGMPLQGIFNPSILHRSS